jgi:hypothetical protein
VQPVEHIIRGAGHVEVVVQRPSEQVWPVVQRMPQPPQLLGSVFKSAQPVVHIAVRGGAQVVPPVHVPFVQVWPAAQGLLHRPQ